MNDKAGMESRVKAMRGLDGCGRLGKLLQGVSGFGEFWLGMAGWER